MDTQEEGGGLMDQEAFDKAFASLKAYCDRTFEMLDERIEIRLQAIEARPLPKGEKGDAGTVDIDAVKALVEETIEGMRDSLKGEPGEKGDAGPAGEKGETGIGERGEADPELVRSLVAETVERSLAAWERPRDGKDGESVTVEQVLPVILTHIDRTIEALPKAKDGLDAVSFVVDEDGHLNVTMSNGSVKDLGKFRGKDCDMAVVASQVQELFDAWPKPKDGADGIGFENMEIETREDGVYQTWTAGAEKKEVRIPSLIYRGTWKADQVYKRGDFVTWAGGMWFCKTETTAKPEPAAGEEKDWTLAVKRGDDARLPKVKL